MISRPGDIEQGMHPDESAARRTWTVADLLTWTEGHFHRRGMATPRLDAELLLAHAMRCTRLELYTGYRRVVEPDERARFRALVERRGRHEPVAYILGQREFYSLAFEVGPAVLVPRPETEVLVDRVLELLRPAPPAAADARDAARDAARGAEGRVELAAAPPPPSPSSPLRFLDLGVGSGNIAIAVLVNVAGSRAVAVDASREALAVARRNAERHGVLDRLELREGDLFAPFARDGAVFDAIVSNPPYIAPAEFPHLMADVRDHEPALALVDRRPGPAGRQGDGLGFYRAIARQAARHLAPAGLLALEVGAGQARAVEALLEEAGWRSLRISSDFAGIPRVITARRGAGGETS